MADFRIPTSHVEHAFEVLKSGDHAAARAAYEFAEKHLKVVLAKEAGKSNAPSAAQRESDGLRSDAYSEALGEFRKVAETYFHQRDRREAAGAILDAYRTQRADDRELEKLR